MKKAKKIQNGLIILLLIALIWISIYGIRQRLPLQIYIQNCNRNFVAVTSIWWNPINGDYPYADLIVHSLSKGKTIRMSDDNPYLSYFSSLTSNVDIVNETNYCPAEYQYSLVGKANFFTNKMFLEEDFFNLLMERNCIVDVYVDVNSIQLFDNIRLSINKEGDIYLNGEE